MTVVLVDRANACQNFDNYWSKIQNLMKNWSKNVFFGLLGFGANSGFWLCDTILGFGANSGFWCFDTIFAVWSAGFRFFDTILGFGVQGLGFATRVQGLGFWCFHTTSGFGVLVFWHQIRVWGFGQKTQNFPSKIHCFHQKGDNLARVSSPARVRNHQK